ncbi:hypothetical protein [Microbulbifer sp. JTAC008]|uniref:hypothetical protein n=1 Tax=unclassified Microbulbifer TaxID=2619833 RepID=UPI0040398CA6
MSDLSEKKANQINLFLAYLAVLTPAGYLVGLSFYQGKLAALGVSTEVFPLAVQDAYVSAYYAIGYLLIAVSSICSDFLKLIFSWPRIIYTLIAFCSFIGLCYWIIKSKKRSNSKLKRFLWLQIKKIISYLHWKNNDFTKAVGIAGLASYGILSILYVLAFIAVFWFAIPAASYYRGLDYGASIRSNYLESGCHIGDDDFWGNCHTVNSKDGKLIFKGILVVHAKDHVAFFHDGGSIVMKIPEGANITKDFRQRKMTSVP